MCMFQSGSIGDTLEPLTRCFKQNYILRGDTEYINFVFSYRETYLKWLHKYVLFQLVSYLIMLYK